MRVIASFLFLSSITLLVFTHHALARLETTACVEAHFIRQTQRGPQQAPPAFQKSKHPPAQARANMPSNHSIRLSVTGKPQVDEHKAYQDALREAREQLICRLRELKPDLRWEGPRSKELEHLITSSKTESEFFKPPIDAVLYTTRLELEVTRTDQSDLLRHVRLEEAGVRQWSLLKPFLAVLAVLLTVAGYYRLEDMTKGYYTLLLRLSAVALLGIVGFAIFFAWL